MFYTFFAAFAVTGPHAHATTFVNRPLGDVIKETQHIVRGRAGDHYSDWDKGGNRSIYTYTYLNITEVLKGDIKETRIVLRQPGGVKDGMEMSVPGTAHFRADEDVVVMLGEKNKEDGAYDVPGFTTGKYTVSTGENGEPVLVNSLGGGAIYDPSKDAKTLSYNSSIPLEVFRRAAKGEDIPEAAHKQYSQSAKPAPRGAFEAGHNHNWDKPRATPVPTVTATAEAPAPPQETRRSLWIPLSFALLAAAGGVILWKTIGVSRGGSSKEG